MQVTVSWLKDCFEAGAVVQVREHHLPEGPRHLQNADAHAINDALPLTRHVVQSHAVQGGVRASPPTPFDYPGLCSDDVDHREWLDHAALLTSPEEIAHQLHNDDAGCFNVQLPSSSCAGAFPFAADDAVAYYAISTAASSAAAVATLSALASPTAICNAAAVPGNTCAIDQPVIRTVTPTPLPQPLPQRGAAAAIDTEPSDGGDSGAAVPAVGAPARLSRMIRSSTVANAESV